MYIDAAAQTELLKARLVSPAQPKTSGHCIHFYYNVYGDDIGALNVYALKRGEGYTDPVYTYGFSNLVNSNSFASFSQTESFSRAASSPKEPFRAIIKKSNNSVHKNETSNY